MFETFLVVTAGGGQGELLLLCGQRPGMLLNILQGTGQPPSKELSTVLRLRNPGLGDPGSCKGKQPFPVIKKCLISLVII